MANYEHRSDDKDDVRVFDGGDDDDEEQGSHLPVVIIIAILVLAAFGGVVWLAYNQGVARGRNDVPVRVAETSAPAGGGQIKVYQQPAGEEEEIQPVTATPAQHPAAAPPAKVAQATPPPTGLAPVRPAPEPPPIATKPPAQLGVATPPEEKPAAAPPKPVAAPPKSAATSIPKPAEVAPPKKIASAAPAPALSAGAYLLQVGAYKSQGEAMAAWKTYKAKHATLVADLNPDVQQADLGSKGVWYRLRVGPFSDKSAALGLCERLKAESGACFLAR